VSVRRRLSSALLILSLAGGCATALPPPREAMSEDARRAVGLLASRWKEFSDFRALADVLLARGNRKEQLTGALLLKAPASLRFEALAPFGQPLMIATIHDDQLVVYNAAANTATQGPATPDAAARLFGIAVEPQDLVGLLAGRAVPPADLRVAAVLPPDDHGPSLEMIGDLHRQRVWMDFASGVVRRLQITGGRIEALAIYRFADDGTLAGFDLTAAQGNVTGTVRYRNVVIGAGIEAERFRLTIPPGAAIQRLR
jgi:outer membrane lipoprotein-sorting protein